MASFQAKIGWKMMRKREISKNIKKKYPYEFFSSENRFVKYEKGRK